MKEWLLNIFITYWYFIIPYILVILTTHVLKTNLVYYSGFNEGLRIVITVMILCFITNIIPFLIVKFDKLYLRIIMYFVYSFLCWSISCSVISLINKLNRAGIFEKIIVMIKHKLGRRE